MSETPSVAGPRRLCDLIASSAYGRALSKSEYYRMKRNRAMDHARSNALHATQLDFGPYADMYRDVASTYVSIARGHNRRLVEALKTMRLVSP